MATNYTHLSEQASVSEVLKLVVLEHRELRAQYKEVTTRIRDLRIAVRTLRTLGRKGAPAIGREETKVSTEGEHSAAQAGVGSLPDFRADVDADRSESALRRAIRIAVFET